MSMRGVVVLDELREAQVRPRGLFGRYVRLLEQDARTFFRGRGRLTAVACPACGTRNPSVAFTRFGLAYRECRRCLTLYLSPRPTPAALSAYYAESRSARFWDRTVMKQTDRERHEHVVQLRLDWLLDVVNEFLPPPRRLLDWQSKSPSFLEDLSRLRAFDSVGAVSPTPEAAEVCRRLGMAVFDGARQTEPASAVTAFEVLEREFNPQQTIARIHDRLAPNGLVLLTTRTISGFELRVLWDKAQNLLPPAHMNLFSIEALTQVLERQGLEILELSTPGQLDVEIVHKALANGRKVEVSRFLRYLLQARSPETHQAFQEFLQRHRLSAHVRLVARKR